MRKPHRPGRRDAQTGAVLFVALILLLVLSLLAVAAARMQTVEERIARNENNRQVGAAAAEATLRYVEANLQRGTYQNFGNSPGLYNLNSEILSYNGSVLQTLNWSSSAQTLTYAGPPLNAVPAPKYIIESLPPVVSKGNQLNGSKARPVYRVTVQAQGADQTSTTVLQSIVHY